MKAFNIKTFFKFMLPDAVSICGIFLIGYGLFLFKPWVSYSVVGLLTFIYVLVRTNKIQKIDVRDILFIGGLTALGYGLYLKAPWISFSVCGAILMLSGYIMRDSK